MLVFCSVVSLASQKLCLQTRQMSANTCSPSDEEIYVSKTEKEPSAINPPDLLLVGVEASRAPCVVILYGHQLKS